MRNLSTFIILALAVSTAVAQKNITADFKDARFLAQVRQNIGKPTGAIYDTDVAKIKYLHIIQKGIENLAGIEHFTNLRGLFCSKNKLTSIDLSNNHKLDWLECSNNQFTELDLSNNPLMIKVWVQSNQLTKINLSNNPKLNELWCFRNNLSEIDISNNTVLVELRCSHNQLTSIDLSKNVKLSRMDVSHNQLTELDMSKNPDLEGGFFVYYSNNKITSVKRAPTKVEPVPVKAKITAINNKAPRTKQEIMAVVNDRLYTLVYLYKRHLRMESHFKGNVTLELTIASDGYVSNVNIESDIAGYKEFNVEVRDIVENWIWKAIDGGNTTVTISFNFKD